MCEFFSLVSNGDGKPMYFDAVLRAKIRSGDMRYELDSHTSIADYFGFKGEKEDKLNKYEYNPLLKKFKVDQLNNPNDDSKEIKKFCENLDFKTIVPELIIKPIVNPFVDFKVKKATKEDLELLKQWSIVWSSVWVSVGPSVGYSVWDSVWAIVGSSLGYSVWDSVGYSVGSSVWGSVGSSVGSSVWVSVGSSVGYSVWGSVGSSVWGSIWAYCSTFLDIKYKHDFSSAIKLWEKGIVPSFDGKLWRLHGHKGKVIWSGNINDL